MTTLFTKDHEWVRVDGDIATVGISNHAQEQLGDVVFVELPEVGRKVSQAEAVAVVESVKAASDIYAPVSGEVVERNAGLEADPALVNTSPEDAAWFFKVRLASRGELDGLMDAGAYKAFVESQG